MSEKTAFQKAKEQAAGANLPAVLPESSDSGSTALTVTPADREILSAEREHYNITEKVIEAAVQQFQVKQDLSALPVPMQIAFMQYEKKRLGVEGHCIELLKNKAGKVVPYYNDECAVQMKEKREAATEYSNYGTITINETTLAHVDCTMTKKDGRKETRRAYLDVTGIKGQDLGNLLMKLETKAHRRSVLKGFGLTADSPDDGDGTIVKSLEGDAKPEPPSIQNVFGQAGTSLIGAVQQEPVASNPSTAAQETGESPAKEEAADDAEIVTASSEAAAEDPKTTQASDSNTSTEAKETGAEPGKSESGTKSTKGKKTKSQESPSTTSTSSSAAECAISENQTPGTATGQSDKANISPSPESAPSTSTETNSGASSEGKSEDGASVAASQSAAVGGASTATTPGEEGTAPSDEDDDPDYDALFGEEEDEISFDPEDAKIVSEPQLRELFAIAKACGWEKESIAEELKRHTKAEKANDVPKLLTVGEWKQGKEWFSDHSPGDQWFPIGEEPQELEEGEVVEGE